MIDPFRSISEASELRSLQGAPQLVQSNGNTEINSAADELLSNGSDLPACVETDPGDIRAIANTPLPRPLHSRQPLHGGTYTPGDALRMLNSHYFIGKNSQETAVFRLNDDGSATFLPAEQFKLEIQNVFIKCNGSSKPISGEKFWKEHPARHERVIVFKPTGTTGVHEFNLWRGFGVEQRKGWQKQRSLLRHIREIICRRDRDKFKYVIRYLAWTVQNPDKHAGVIIVLKSRKQGTGKSTLGKVMLSIFGPHGALIDDKERLLGRFTDWLENTCFVVAEEILWAGDHKAADKLKSVITGDTIQIERKFGSCRQVPNRLKTLATTNHDHAVAAGVRDRRNVVLDVSDERVGDKAWFDRLYRDLAAGGTNEFLALLLRVKLGDWHPRQILKTSETIEQQRMSGDSASQWALACIDADAVVGASMAHDLGGPISAETLREAYNGFCRQNGQRPLSTETFGKVCAEMFGPRKRLRALQCSTGGKGKRRPWGYHVPTGTKWREKVDARLGIKD
jgi:hypothetical protein